MAKKITKQIKLQIPAGKATPAPPVGTALGPAGVNIGAFVNEFNEKTKSLMGDIIPIIINVYDDRSFTFIMKKPPASRLILKKLGIEKGSGKNMSERAGKITRAQLGEIADEKGVDTNAGSRDANINLLAGTARSMGIDVV